MSIFRGIIAAFSIYSVIPMPHINWKAKGTGYAISFFPIVGIFLGTLLYGWFCVCDCLEISKNIFAAIAVAIPVLVTGGIHLDGYMDTVDAIASHSDKQRRLEIMKDSHPGAFACIYISLYFLIQFAFFQNINENNIIWFIGIFAISRSLSGIVATLMPGARNNGMLSDMLKTADSDNNKKNIGLIIFPFMVMAMIIILYMSLDISLTMIIIAAEIMWVLIYCIYMKTTIGGVTGDTSGFFLQISELIGQMLILL